MPSLVCANDVDRWRKRATHSHIASFPHLFLPASYSFNFLKDVFLQLTIKKPCVHLLSFEFWYIDALSLVYISIPGIEWSVVNRKDAKDCRKQKEVFAALGIHHYSMHSVMQKAGIKKKTTANCLQSCKINVAWSEACVFFYSIIIVLFLTDYLYSGSSKDPQLLQEPLTEDLRSHHLSQAPLQLSLLPLQFPSLTAQAAAINQEHRS